MLLQHILISNHCVNVKKCKDKILIMEKKQLGVQKCTHAIYNNDFLVITGTMTTDFCWKTISHDLTYNSKLAPLINTLHAIFISVLLSISTVVNIFSVGQHMYNSCIRHRRALISSCKLQGWANSICLRQTCLTLRYTVVMSITQSVIGTHTFCTHKITLW